MKNIENAVSVYKQLTEGKKKKSIEAMILGHLLKHGPLTPMDAIRQFECTRLSARIYDLEHKYPIKIKHERINKGNKTYMRYSLEEDENA